MREKRKFREGIRERGREVDDGVSCGTCVTLPWQTDIEEGGEICQTCLC